MSEGTNQDNTVFFQNGRYEIDPRFIGSQQSTSTPHKKVPFGHLDFELYNLPAIYVYEIATFAGSSTNQVESTKFRELAVQEFIDTKLSDLLGDKKNLIATNLKVKKGEGEKREDQRRRYDHIIIPIVGDAQPPFSVDSDRVEAELQELKWKVRSANETMSEEPVQCILYPGRQLKENEALYWTSLDHLLRDQANKKRTRYPDQIESYRKDRIIPTDIKYLEIKAGKDPASPYLNNDNEDGLRKLKTVRTRPRYQPKLECQSGGRAHLLLEFDLALYIQSCRLTDVLLDIFGHSILGAIDSRQFSAIKHLLVGLDVRYAYKIERKAEGHFTYTQLPVPQDELPDADKGRRCTIHDIRLPGHVEGFRAKNADGEEKMFSITKHFNEVVLSGRPPLKYEGLPLAHVGHIKGGSKVWIPLEMLMINKEQPLRASGHLTERLKDQVKTYLSSGINLKQIGENFMDDASNERTLLNWSTPKYTEPHIRSAKKQSKNSSNELASRKVDPRTGRSVSVGMIYVAPSHHNSKETAKLHEAFVNQCIARLCKADMLNMNISETRIVRNLEEISSLKFEQPASKEKDGKKPMLMLLGAVDTQGRSKEEIRDLYAELQRVGNRVIGAPITCTTKQSLEDLFANHDENSNYFPANIIRKMKYMMGGTNFVDHTEGSTPETHSRFDNIMVAGAHIAHAGPGAVPHCPSVAGIVASCASGSAVYPGSARLQPALKNFGKGGIQDPRIKDLRGMMQERFTAWKNKNKQGPIIKPAGLVFFRDACFWDDKVIQKTGLIDKEIKDIKQAYSDVFDEKSPGKDMSAEKYLEKEENGFPITYVLVMKNGKRPIRGEIVHYPTFDFTMGSKENPTKHLYVVLQNGPKFDKDSLMKWTQNLNHSSQLSAEVALALPVWFARKLCKRVFDYIHPFRTSDLGQLPHMMDAIRSKKVADAGEEMTALVQNHLAGTEYAVPKTPSPQPGSADKRQNPWPKSLDPTMFYL